MSMMAIMDMLVMSKASNVSAGARSSPVDDPTWAR
jgi:hypothetical protein